MGRARNQVDDQINASQPQPLPWGYTRATDSSRRHIRIPQPDGRRFAYRPLQRAVTAIAGQPKNVVGSTLWPGGFKCWRLATLNTGTNNRKIFFVHLLYIVPICPNVKAAH